MKVVYFAWLKTRTGLDEEDVSPPESVSTVADLIEWLKGRDEGHAHAFEDSTSVCVAVNHEYVENDHQISEGDEIAFFPPVTGG